MALALVVGLIVAVARISRLPVVSHGASLYVDFFRSTPLLVQLVWIFFVLPVVLGFSLDSLQSGIISLGLYFGAFFAEIYRAGIRAVEKGQWDAARALGMTHRQSLERIILPQAVVVMLPIFGGMFVTLIKDSALVSSIGVFELMRQGMALSGFLFRPLEVITVVAILYVLITYPTTVWINYLHKRYLAN